MVTKFLSVTIHCCLSQHGCYHTVQLVRFQLHHFRDGNIFINIVYKYALN